MRIDSLTLRAFRGATTETIVEFDSKKSIALIYGENGTGKSTIVDGIDSLCNENCGSLEERSLDGSHKRKHLASLGRNDKDVTVEMRSGDLTWSSTLTSGGPKTLGPENRPSVHVLRRARLTKLVEATSQQKYDELAGFVNATQVEQAEAELRKAVAEAFRQLDSATKTVEVANRTLERTWNELGKPGAPELDHIGWAELEARRDLSTEKLQAKAARLLLNEISQLEAAILRRDQALTITEEWRTKRDNLLRDSLADQVFSFQQQLDLVQVLDKASRFLSLSTGNGACPVCQTDQDLSSLKRQIDQRVTEISRSNKQLGEFQGCDSECKKAEAAFESATLEVIGVAIRLSKLWNTKQGFLPVLPESVAAQTLATLQDVAISAEPLATELAQSAAAVKAALETIEESAAKDDNHLTAIRNNLVTLHEEQENAKDWEAKHQLLTAIHAQVRLQRIDFAQSILDNVHEDCDAIYQAMHPGEGIGPEALMLDPEKRGSVKQPCRFGAHTGVPPAAYYSESHTDTLALALFIAIAKRQGGKSSILVLDDIFTSVDGPHLQRVMTMLTEESKQFAQVIITTHFRRIYELYRHNRASTVDLKELDRWHLDHGVGVHGTRLEISLLRETLQTRPLDRNGIASRAGYLLDAALDHLTVKYETNAPRKANGEYSLKDLYDSFRKVAKKLEVQQGNLSDANWHSDGGAVQIDPFFAALEGSNIIRNQVGGHFNILGQDTPDTEVAEFGTRVEAFVSAVICQHCQCLPTKPTESHWECDCGACRTFPRRKP